MNLSFTTAEPILTPCIGICSLNDDGLCEGCFRNGDEIAQWSSLSNQQRQRLMLEVLPMREAIGALTPCNEQS